MHSINIKGNAAGVVAETQDMLRVRAQAGCGVGVHAGCCKVNNLLNKRHQVLHPPRTEAHGDTHMSVETNYTNIQTGHVHEHEQEHTNQTNVRAHECAHALTHQYSARVVHAYHAYPQCLLSDTVPIRTRTWTLRPPATLHRTLPWHTIPYQPQLGQAQVSRPATVVLGASMPEALAVVFAHNSTHRGKGLCDHGALAARSGIGGCFHKVFIGNRNVSHPKCKRPAQHGA